MRREGGGERTDVYRFNGHCYYTARDHSLAIPNFFLASSRRKPTESRAERIVSTTVARLTTDEIAERGCARLLLLKNIRTMARRFRFRRRPIG